MSSIDYPSADISSKSSSYQTSKQSQRRHNPSASHTAQPAPTSLETRPDKKPKPLALDPKRPLDRSQGERQADVMATLKLRRLTNLTHRLRTELNYDRIPASQACEALVQFMQNVPENPRLKDYLVPEVFGSKPAHTLDGAGHEPSMADMLALGGEHGMPGYFIENENKGLVSNGQSNFQSGLGGCCVIS